MRFEELLGVNFWTALFTLANTVALFLVLKKYLFQPVMKIIQARQEEIDQIYDTANSAQEQAEKLRGEYEQKLSEAQSEAERLVKEAVNRGQNREEEILRQANAEADAIREKASQDIDREKRKALNAAKDEITVIALSIAGKVVGRELRPEDQGRLVDAFIEELGEEQ